MLSEMLRLGPHPPRREAAGHTSQEQAPIKPGNRAGYEGYYDAGHDKVLLDRVWGRSEG